MDDGVFDQLARRIAATLSRRAVVGRGLLALIGAGAAVGVGGVEGEAQPHVTRPPRGPECKPARALCSSTDECCPATTGRICGQNGGAIPDRPRCCAGIGVACRGGLDCCGYDRHIDCVGGLCAYIP
jgi:hypothetical protein